MHAPSFHTNSALQFVVNGRSGSSDAEATRDAIESALRAAGRTGTVHFASPGELQQTANEAASIARAEDSAVVAVGGDGTINTVAQAAHNIGCTMGVIAEGTFNYFAREHGVPEKIDESLPWLFAARPEPVQISAVNERVFLVNASLGLYPDLLQDREKWKARFGRSRMVAFSAGMSTLLRARRHLRLSITSAEQRRAVLALTLFVGNNRLQLEQLGLEPRTADGSATTGDGLLRAVILRPIGAVAMLALMTRGAAGQLGEADSVEHFACETLTVTASSVLGRRRMKVAFDGEVSWLTLPLTMRVLPHPLWLLKRAGDAVV